VKVTLALALAAVTAGCLLPQPPAEPRYFTPRAPDSVDAPAPGAPGPTLRLRRVRAAAYLRTRMVWRRGVEIGFYDLWRWTESPSRFVQDSLETELFERRGFQRTTQPGEPAVDATLESFDERFDPTHEAVVALDVRVTDAARAELLDRSFEVRRPIRGDSPEAIADALGEALAVATHEVGDAVAGALGAGPH
jgi:ABC-type uncharacterized transport system auxiliary subunit